MVSVTKIERKYSRVKHISAFVLMQVCACLKDHMRVDYVFCALCMVCPAALFGGIAKTGTGKACNECKHLVNCDWSVLNCSVTNVVFQTGIFLLWLYEISPQALTIKPATAFTEIFHITIIASCVSAGNCSLNHLNL